MMTQIYQNVADVYVEPLIKANWITANDNTLYRVYAFDDMEPDERYCAEPEARAGAYAFPSSGCCDRCEELFEFIHEDGEFDLDALFNFLDR